MKDSIKTIEEILKKEFHCDALQANLVANHILDELDKIEEKSEEEE